MPYNPGVQDISGQLLARGIESAAQARAQGIGAIGGAISNLFGTYAQKRAQDEEFMAKAKSMEAFIKTHADDFAPVDPQTGQKNPDAVLQFLQQSPDENAKQKYMRLGTFLDTAVTGTKMQQAQAATRFEQMRADAAKLELDKQKALNAYQNRLLSEGAAETAVGTEPTSAMPAPVSGPASLGMFTQAMGVGAPQPQMAATVPAQRKGPILRDWLNSETPPQIEDAQKELAISGDPNFMKNSLSRQKEMFKEWKDARTQKAIKSYSNEEEAQIAADAFNAEPKNAGTVALVQPDARGGFAVKKQTTSFETADQAATKVEQTELAKGAVSANAKIAADAARAGAQNVRIDRMTQLLNYESGLTGKGEEKLAALRGYAARLGWADAEKVSKQDELNALMKREQLDIVNETMQKGSTSDKERELFASTVASLEKTPQANLRLLELTRAANDKAIAAERQRQRLKNAGLNERQIKDAMERWVNADENNIQNFIPTEERFVVGPSGNLIAKPKGGAPIAPAAATPGKLPSGWSISK